jgi:hypothetical protein
VAVGMSGPSLQGVFVIGGCFHVPSSDSCFGQ